VGRPLEIHREIAHLYTEASDNDVATEFESMFYGPHEVLATNGHLGTAVPTGEDTARFVIIEPDQCEVAGTGR